MDLVLRILIGCVLFLFMGGVIDIRGGADTKLSFDDSRHERLEAVINKFRDHFNSFALDPEMVYRTRRPQQFFVDLDAWTLQQEYGKPMYVGNKIIGTRYSKKVKTYFSCAERPEAVCYAVDMNNFAGQYIRGAQGKLCSSGFMEDLKVEGVDSVGFYLVGREKPLATCTNGMRLFEIGEDGKVI